MHSKCIFATITLFYILFIDFQNNRKTFGNIVKLGETKYDVTHYLPYNSKLCVQEFSLCTLYGRYF